MSASLDFSGNRLRFLRARDAHCKMFSCQSARALVWRDSGRAWTAEYSGVLTADCFANLRALVIAETQDASVMTLNMSRALMAIPEAPQIPADTYGINHTPGAVVVRQDQFDAWRNYAGQMADLGIIRVVFLVSQLPQARRWAACLAAGRG